MGKPIEDLECQIFDWPDRFFVESETPDRDYALVFPNVPPEIYPHLADLSEPMCDCRDFTYNIIPYLHQPIHRTECKHLMAARRYRNLIGNTKPKKLYASNLF